MKESGQSRVWSFATFGVWIFALVALAAAILLRLFPWGTTTYVPPITIGLVAQDGSDLTHAFLPATTPSIDLDIGPNLVNGIFRINPISIPKTNKAAKIGIILPQDAQIAFAGAQGEMMTLGDQSSEKAYKGYGFSCESTGGPTGPSKPNLFLRIQDGVNDQYSVDCGHGYAIAWVQFPASRTASAGLVAGRQDLISDSAAQIYFTLRDPDRRLSFATWSTAFELQTAPSASVQSAIPVADAFPTDTSIRFSICGGSTGTITPSTYDIEPRSYYTDRPMAVTLGPCPTWRVPLDGRVHSFAANLSSGTRNFWYNASSGVFLVLVGALLGSFLAHPRTILPALRGRSPSAPVGQLKPRTSPERWVRRQRARRRSRARALQRRRRT